MEVCVQESDSAFAGTPRERATQMACLEIRGYRHAWLRAARPGGILDRWRRSGSRARGLRSDPPTPQPAAQTAIRGIPVQARRHEGIGSNPPRLDNDTICAPPSLDVSRLRQPSAHRSVL